jgi:uncharacterized membrane protein YciS (DUF1049 family)
MKIIRTIIWVLLAVALVIFSINNWNTVDVKIWENLVLETKLPALVIVAFLAGLLPVWLLHRGTRWRMQRRINSLETAVRNATAAAAPPPAAPTATPAATEEAK